ncbi:hypothetical protein A3Q56_03169 [Intoshia linei]|uniref:EGF-like domain-containing protein n=1 Tax=Intoshia linei TaxID=1819745 RepID=A0A177B4D0_9BILA|nr:hypothetical protein A3Q56_03169 [Intoshia linei]
MINVISVIIFTSFLKVSCDINRKYLNHSIYNTTVVSSSVCFGEFIKGKWLSKVFLNENFYEYYTFSENYLFIYEKIKVVHLKHKLKCVKMEKIKKSNDSNDLLRLFFQNSIKYIQIYKNFILIQNENEIYIKVLSKFAEMQIQLSENIINYNDTIKKPLKYSYKYGNINATGDFYAFENANKTTYTDTINLTQYKIQQILKFQKKSFIIFKIQTSQITHYHYVCAKNIQIMKIHLWRIFALSLNDQKSKSRYRLGDKLSHDMRVGLSQTKPDMMNLFTIKNNKNLINYIISDDSSQIYYNIYQQESNQIIIKNLFNDQINQYLYTKENVLETICNFNVINKKKYDQNYYNKISWKGGFYSISSRSQNTVQCLGNYCSYHNPCKDQICINQIINGYKCKGHTKYNNTYTSWKTNVCTKDSCLFGGKCIQLKNETFTCQCEKGFTGNICQFYIIKSNKSSLTSQQKQNAICLVVSMVILNIFNIIIYVYSVYKYNASFKH